MNRSRSLRHPRLFAAACVVLAAVAVLAIPAGLAFAQGAPSPAYVVVQTGQGFARLQDAVDAIGNGTATIRVATGTHRDCAVQTAGSIEYVAQIPGDSIFEGTICEGKAALVLRGRSARVTGLVFAGMRVPEGNGAGIRLEHGDLAIGQSWFRDSEEGILTADDPASAILIDKSTFTRLGRCDRDLACAHSIYVGDYGALTIRRSRFEQGRGGHYVKSRAQRIDLRDSSFDDSRGSATNYMVDLPAGAGGAIVGNWFVQGRDKENYSALIAIAAEGHRHSANGLEIAGNDARLAPDVGRTTAFVADWSGDNLAIGENRLGLGLKRFERR
jgi:hypothetical protein